MASRRLIYAIQLTGYATESHEKKYVCCFMRATHAINNIYKLISFQINICCFFYQNYQATMTCDPLLLCEALWCSG